MGDELLQPLAEKVAGELAALGVDVEIASRRGLGYTLEVGQ